jgi:hypothetical protein
MRHGATRTLRAGSSSMGRVRLMSGKTLKKFLTGCGALLAVMATIAVAAPSQGASREARPCVTRGEFRQVHRGMTMSRVHNTFDFAGRQGEASRNYRKCGGARTVVIDYTILTNPMRVAAKYRVGSYDQLAF